MYHREGWSTHRVFNGSLALRNERNPPLPSRSPLCRNSDCLINHRDKSAVGSWKVVATSFQIVSMALHPTLPLPWLFRRLLANKKFHNSAQRRTLGANIFPPSDNFALARLQFGRILEGRPLNSPLLRRVHKDRGFKRYGGIQTKYDKHLARPYLSNITLMLALRGCGAPLGEPGKDNLLEFILRALRLTLPPLYHLFI